MRKNSKQWLFSFLVAGGVGVAALDWVEIRAQSVEPPELELTSLKEVPVPEPVNLSRFVKDKSAAIALGKALFWDMQVGSEGVQACASCHFHAGADSRFKNSVSPGLLSGDVTFQLKGPNGSLTAGHFPLTKFQNPDRPGAEKDPRNGFVQNSNDVISSAGIRNFDFIDVILGQSFEKATPVSDPVFHVGGKSLRQVEPRNTPSVINAVFNFSNFWDGRARNVFNGVNPFGELDEEAKVFVNSSRGLEAIQVRIPDASLASQAVGPVLSDLEMSSRGRIFPSVGKKLLSLRPLDLQKVHSQDSVLGALADPVKGLNTTYAAMIQAAFQEEWWNDTRTVITFSPTDADYHEPSRDEPRGFFFRNGAHTFRARSAGALSTDEFTQMEANFSLFFGLAVQLYEATLVSDDSRFDRVMEGKAEFTKEEEAGFETFMNQGRCIDCHGGAEFTNHSVREVRGGLLPTEPGFVATNFIERMSIANRGNVIYDNGFYNIGVRPGGSNIPGEPGYVANTADVGRGATAPTINPLTGQPYPLSIVRLAKLKAQNLLPPGVAEFVPRFNKGVPSSLGVAVDGSMKAPGLRNVELTGPYFHNGDAATLQQVVEFYVRGGNFPKTNAFNLDADIDPIGRLSGHPERQRELVAFLKTLTDERVRQEMAPFDHPQLFIANGSPGDENSLLCSDDADPDFHKSFCDDFIEIPAVGAEGRPAEGMPPLGTFLNLDPEQS